MAACKKITSAAIEALEGRQLHSGSPYSAKLIGNPHFYEREFVSQPLATFNHPASMDTSNVVSSISWGDGATEGYFVSQNLTAVSATQMSVTNGQAMHSYGKPGIYNLKVTFSLGKRILATVRKALKVTQNSAGGTSVQMKTGDAAPVVLGTISSATASADPLTISWGDGQVGAAVVTPLKNHQYRISGSHTYAKAGTYRVRVLSDPSLVATFLTQTWPLASDVLGSTAVARGMPKTPALPSVTLTAPTDTVLNPGRQVLATVNGLTPGGLALAPTATINWGDNSADRGLVEVVDGHYVVYANVPSHTSDYTATATIRLFANNQIDPTKGSLLATLNQQFTVKATSPGAIPFTIGGGLASDATFSGVLAVITASASRVPVSLNLNWGDSFFITDSSVDPGQVEPGEAATITPIGNNQYQISGTHTYTYPNVFRVFGTLYYSDGSTEQFVDIGTVLAPIV